MITGVHRSNKQHRINNYTFLMMTPVAYATSTHPYTHTHTHTHTHMYPHVHKYAHTHVHMHTHAYTHTHTHIRTHVHTQTYTHHTHTHIYILAHELLRITLPFLYITPAMVVLPALAQIGVVSNLHVVTVTTGTIMTCCFFTLEKKKITRIYPTPASHRLEVYRDDHERKHHCVHYSTTCSYSSGLYIPSA